MGSVGQPLWSDEEGAPFDGEPPADDGESYWWHKTLKIVGTTKKLSEALPINPLNHVELCPVIEKLRGVSEKTRGVSDIPLGVMKKVACLMKNPLPMIEKVICSIKRSRQWELLKNQAKRYQLIP